MTLRSDTGDPVETPLTSYSHDEETLSTLSAASRSPSDSQVFWPNAITELLVVIGSASDAAQKLFALGQFFGIQNFSQELMQAQSSQRQAVLIGLLLSLSTPFIQSYCLEKDFSKNLVHYFFGLEQLHHLNDDQRQSLSTLQDGQYGELFDRASHLHPVEWAGVYLMALVAGTLRSICTYLGFIVLGGGPAIQAIAMGMAVIDAFQICATDGHFFKNFYLSLRLWLTSHVSPDSYNAAFLRDMHQHLGQDNWQTRQGFGVFIATLVLLGMPGLISEAGLTQLSLELFTDPQQGVLPLDQHSPAFLAGESFSLINMASFMFSLDVLVLAKTASQLYEGRLAADKPLATNPLMGSLGLAISAISAAITLVCAYQGAHFILNRWFGNSVAKLDMASALFCSYIALTKFFVSLAVEGTFTYQKFSQIPLCTSINTCLKSMQNTAYRRLPSDDRCEPLLAASPQSPDAKV